VGESLGRLVEAQGDDLRFLFSIEQLFAGRFNAFFAVQGDFESFGDESLTDVLDGLGTARKGLGDPCVGPPGTIGVGLEQNVSPSHFLKRALLLANQFFERASLLIGQSNNVLLLHGNPP
jgi:hypothetical protein